MKNILLCVLLFTVLKGYGQQADTSEIYFDVNVAQMSTSGTRTLDSLRFSKIVASGHKTMIYGFGDYLGSDDINRALSSSRAKNVKEYLVSLGMDPRDVIICEGKGKIIRSPKPGEHGVDRDRKVTIITELGGSTAKTKNKKTENADVVNKATNSSDSSAIAAKTKKKKTKTSVNPDGTLSGTTNPVDSAALAAKANKKKTKTGNPADATHIGTTNPTDSAALAAKANKKKTKTGNPADATHVGTTNPADSAALAAKANKKKTKTGNPADATHTGATNPTDSAALAAKANKKKTKTGNPADATHVGTTNPADSAALAAKANKKKTKTGNPADGTHTGTTSPVDSAALAAKTNKKKTKTGNPADGTHTGTNNPLDSAALAAKANKKKTGNPTDGTHTGTVKPTDPNTTLKTGKPIIEKPIGTHPVTPGHPDAIATSVKTPSAGSETIAPIEGKTEIGPMSGGELSKTGINNKKTGSSSTDSLRSNTKLIPRRPDVVVRKPEKDIPTLNPAKLGIGEIVPLNDIYFAPASNEMLRQSEPSLEQLYKFLKDNSNLAVEIEGRICCMSPLDGVDEPDGHGSTRSTARAKNIYDYLIAKGIDKKRISYAGLGNTKPTVYPEKTEFDRGLNRRPVMKIIRNSAAQ